MQRETIVNPGPASNGNQTLETAWNGFRMNPFELNFTYLEMDDATINYTATFKPESAWEVN